MIAAIIVGLVVMILIENLYMHLDVNPAISQNGNGNIHLIGSMGLGQIVSGLMNGTMILCNTHNQAASIPKRAFLSSVPSYFEANTNSLSNVVITFFRTVHKIFSRDIDNQ